MVSTVAGAGIVGTSLEEKAFAVPIDMLLRFLKLSAFVAGFFALRMLASIPLHRKRLTQFGRQYSTLVDGYMRSKLGIFLLDKQWSEKVKVLLD